MCLHACVQYPHRDAAENVLSHASEVFLCWLCSDQERAPVAPVYPSQDNGCCLVAVSPCDLPAVLILLEAGTKALKERVAVQCSPPDLTLRCRLLIGGTVRTDKVLARHDGN